MKTYAKTLRELGDHLELSERQVARYKRYYDNFPTKVKGKGYSVGDCIRWRIENIKADLESKESEETEGGDPTINKLRAEKIQVEIDILKLRYEKERETVISLAEHHENIRLLSQVYIKGLEQWIRQVSMRKDVELLQWAKDIQERNRQYIIGLIKEIPVDGDNE